MGVTKALKLSDMRLEDYLVDKYGLFLDMRNNDDNKVHGSGRRIENASERITLQLEKKRRRLPVDYTATFTSSWKLNSIIENGRFHSAIY